MSATLGTMGDAVTVRLVRQEPADFEVAEVAVDAEEIQMVLLPMPPQKVDRKPEGERTWKWWEAYSVAKLGLQWDVQDEEGTQFKIVSRTDWGKAGFFVYELVEQPRGMGQGLP